MKWFEACMNPLAATSLYSEVPPLNPFSVFHCELDESFEVSGELPRLPDYLQPLQDQIFEKACLRLHFSRISDLKVTGVPDQVDGELQIDKLGNANTHFSYESGPFRFSGKCEFAHIRIWMQASVDPASHTPRGPRLFSHHNVWNTCLCLLREYGYTLQATAHYPHENSLYSFQWHATLPDKTKLSGNTPIELLGLAALHRHHQPNIDEAYWWRI